MDRRRFIERLIAFQLGIPLTGCANLFENQDRSGGSLPKSKSLTGKEEHLLNLIDSCSDRPTLLDPIIKTPEEAFNTFQFEWAAKKKLDPAAFLYLACGAEDNLTLRANRRVFEDTQIKVRRFQNVSKVDTKTSIFGAKYPSPLFICPCGLQTAFHPESEVPVAKSAQDSGYLMMLSTVATKTYEEVKEHYRGDLWFQLYPTPDRKLTDQLLARVKKAGCKNIVITIDAPILGKRERALAFKQQFKQIVLQGGVGHFRGNTLKSVLDPTLTWEFIEYVRKRTQARIILKGIVTASDAKKAIQYKADAIYVSNHGGRQEESNRSTLESLVAVKSAVGNRLPIMFDGGIRRGSDAFKALAAGADFVGVGRPYLWGLSAFGKPGVDAVMKLLQSELVHTMQLAGTRDVKAITSSYMTSRTL